MTVRPRKPIAVALTIFLNLSFLLLGAGWSASSQAGPPTVTVNGSPLAPGVAPVMVADRTFFPVRPLAVALGADVTWNAERREVRVTRGARTITFAIGHARAMVDSKEVSLEAAPILSNGRTLVPLRFVSEMLGATVAWDPATRIIAVAHREGAPIPPPPDSPGRVPTGPLAPRNGRRLVLGYAPVDWPGDRIAIRSLQAYGDRIDAAVFFGLFLDRHGNLTNPGGDSGDLMDAARRGGQKVLLAVHNMDAGSFDRAGAHALLNDAGARARAVENIYRAARDGGFAGVNLDLEGIDPADRSEYTSLVRALADRLRPAGLAVTLAVPAKTSDDRWNSWNSAFDYVALGKLADALVIMAYDEHWPGGAPGPVASLGWAEQVARYVAETIPREKVLFGIAAYGYDWVSGGETIGLSAPSAVNKAARLGIAVRWDDEAQVPYYKYSDGRGREHTVYYENASSMAAKIAMAARHGFAGVALWRLGLEDPAAWEGAIGAKLKDSPGL